jgi:hypothetical protein
MSGEKKETGDAGRIYQVIDEATMAQLNGAYVMPSDAGPAWRAAHEAGTDMSLIEGSLRLSPEQRLEENQQVVNFLLTLQEAVRAHGTK